MKPNTGSAEVWLGTQDGNVEDQEGAQGDRASGRIKADLLRAETSPMQPTSPKRSVIIRDLGSWEACVPFYSDRVQVMLAISRWLVVC